MDDTNFEDELRTLLAAGRKIEAIKHYREQTGVGLKEAKDFIEALIADRHITTPSKAGCLGVVLFVAVALLIIVAKSLAAEPTRPLDFRTISLRGDKGGMLASVDGQPRLVDTRTAWTE